MSTATARRFANPGRRDAEISRNAGERSPSAWALARVILSVTRRTSASANRSACFERMPGTEAGFGQDGHPGSPGQPLAYLKSQTPDRPLTNRLAGARRPTPADDRHIPCEPPPVDLQYMVRLAICCEASANWLTLGSLRRPVTPGLPPFPRFHEASTCGTRVAVLNTKWQTTPMSSAQDGPDMDERAVAGGELVADGFGSGLTVHPSRSRTDDAYDSPASPQ